MSVVSLSAILIAPSGATDFQTVHCKPPLSSRITVCADLVMRHYSVQFNLLTHQVGSFILAARIRFQPRDNGLDDSSVTDLSVQWRSSSRHTTQFPESCDPLLSGVYNPMIPLLSCTVYLALFCSGSVFKFCSADRVFTHRKSCSTPGCSDIGGVLSQSRHRRAHPLDANTGNRSKPVNACCITPRRLQQT